MKKTTEAESRYQHLENMDLNQLLTNINREDQTVALAVEISVHCGLASVRKECYIYDI